MRKTCHPPVITGPLITLHGVRVLNPFNMPSFHKPEILNTFRTGRCFYFGGTMNNTVSRDELAQLESLLPESAHQLIGVIGYAATAKLITHLGGVTLSARQGKAVARNNAAFEKLTSLLTEEEYKKLLACMGGTPFYIPRCDRALIKLRNARFIAELKEMTRQGNSCRSALTVLCPKYGFADRFAWRLLSEHNAAPETQQDCLFD